MGQDTASIASGRMQGAGGAAAPNAAPLRLPWLVLSVVLIGLGGLLCCSLIAVAFVLILYARGGTDGLSDFYQETRFNLPLRTQIGAAVVSALYIGIALATLIAAAWRGRRDWPALVAWRRMRADKIAIAAIFAITLGYAASATLTMTLLQDHRVIISGPTDLVLLGTIAANLALLAPLAEELFFRGWLYTGLRARLSFWPSFIVTAALFAAIHWDVNHRRIFLVLPLALALGVLREVTGSIKPTIALHALYNLIIVAITLAEA